MRARVFVGLLFVACGSEPAPKSPANVAIAEPDAGEADEHAAGEPVDALPARGPVARSARTCTPDGDRAEAKSAFGTAMNAYEEADYERAAELFEQAYAQSCATPVLFNLGNALERAGKPAAAADALEAYLAENPELPLAAEIRERIERLRAAAH